MNPDNNPKRKWERMFPMSCKMHLSCTALLLQLCRPTDLHTNSFIPSSGSGGSAPLLACSPLTCALSNHCSGVQTFIPKTKTRVEIQPVPIKGPAEKPPLRNCLRKRSTYSSCSDHKFHALLGIHNTWWMHNTPMDLIHRVIKFFTRTSRGTFL